MTLQQILALHPVGGTSAELHDALRTAQALQVEHVAKADALEARRAESLLDADDKTLTKLGADAQAARLVADRIAKLVPAIAGEMEATRARETLTALHAGTRQAATAINALAAWMDGPFQQIRGMVEEGFRLQAEAEAARADIVARIDDAYRDHAVRDAGPLGIELPTLPQHPPRAWFPTFR